MCIYNRELLQLNNRKTKKILFFIKAKDLRRHHMKENLLMAKANGKVFNIISYQENTD